MNIKFDTHDQKLFFFTATVLEWNHLLDRDQCKDVLIESFKFLVNEGRVRIFAFVIMPNHFHTVWKIHELLAKSDFQRDILKFTGQNFLRRLKIDDPANYRKLYVGAKDRSINFGKEIPCPFH